MPEPVGVIRSQTLVLDTDNVDTDQIIPARFLTTTSREGLGQHLFADWREKGPHRETFADARARACQILVAGDNFGCGSSREHAPWALLDFGIRAVVSTSVADIFTANAIKNRLLPVVVDSETHRWLLQHPWAEVEIDLARQTLTLPDDSTATFPVDGFAKQCLLAGTDELGWLLAQQERIGAYEQART